MKNILNSSTVKIALGIIIGFGIIILIALAISGSSGQTISQSEAETIALKDAGIEKSEITSLHVRDDYENGQAIYQINFSSATQDYSYQIAKKDGSIISYGFEPQNEVTEIAGTSENGTNETPSSASTDEKPSTSSNTTLLSEEEAKRIAFDDAMVDENDIVFIQVKSDHEKGVAVYDIEFYANGTEYDYEIAKNDGSIIGKDFDIEGYAPNSSGDIISLSDAKAIALARVSGATEQNIKIEFDYDDGYQVYDGEIYYNGVEYEFTIDATNGKVIEWSQEH